MKTCLLRRRPTSLLGACLLAAGVLPGAHAALTENLAVSATAMALGNAVTADPPGIESIHFNPAGLARMTGETHMNSLTVASIRNNTTFNQPDDFSIGGWKDDPINGTSSGDVRQRIFIPGYGMPGWRLPAVVAGGLGFAYNKPGSPFTFGTAAYPTEFASFDRNLNPADPGKFDGSLVQLQRIVYASPAVGYKVSDTLRVGAAVPIAHQAFVLQTDMRAPNVFLGIIGQTQKGWCPEDGGNVIDTLTIGLCSGGPEGRLNPFKKAARMELSMTAPVDPTINLGLLWEPTDWFGLGVVYQSGSKTRLSGRYSFQTEPMVKNFVEGMYASLWGPVIASILGMPQQIPAVQKGNVTATIPFPSHLQLGFKFKPRDYLQLNVDANYTDWGSWDALTFNFDQSIKLLEVMHMFGVTDASKLTIPRGYRSVWHFGYGLQSKVNDKLTLRFGYEPRKSSIPKDKLDLVAPMPDTKLYSVGLNYQLSKDSDISLTASYMTGDYKVPARTSCNLNCDNFFNVIYNPYAGLDVAGSFRVRYFGATYNQRF